MLADLLPVKDPVWVFALVAFLILLAPIVMGRWRLPGMIGLLLAGALLGPNALGVLARDQSFILLGTVGLLYIMFSAALEVDMAVLKRYRLHSLVFGLLTFSIPMGLGLVVAHHGLGFDWPAAILLASTFASHTLLTYPIVSRLGIARNPAVTTAVGGTIVTDTLALLVLAVIASASHGQTIDHAFWYKLVLSLALYVATILVGLPRLARWFFRNASRDGVAEFVFVLAAVFGCAALSHLAGSEPIVGAFLAGLALNRLIPHHSTLMNRIQFTGEAVFVPFFLLSVGMLLDLRIFLHGPRAWIVAIAMVSTVILTKWLAAEATRLLLGFNRDQARLVFSLSVPQAAATLAAVMVGHGLGLFDDTVVNGAIMMILVSCLVAPVIADRHGRALALAGEAPTDTGDAPPERILVACSNPATARPLLELAILLRTPQAQQPIYPVTVVEDGEHTHADIARAETPLGQTVAQLSAAEVPAQPLTRIDLNIAAGLLRARRELRGTTLLVGWRGHRTPPELFFGSMLEHLLGDRDHALLVARLREPLNTCQRIVLALPPLAEREPGFQGAVTLIKRLARQLDASLLIVAEHRSTTALKRILPHLKPEVRLEFLPLERWTTVRRRLLEFVGEGDLVVLYGARPGALAWTPLSAALPTRLAEGLAHTSLLALYPAEPAEDADD